MKEIHETYKSSLGTICIDSGIGYSKVSFANFLKIEQSIEQLNKTFKKNNLKFKNKRFKNKSFKFKSKQKRKIKKRKIYIIDEAWNFFNNQNFNFLLSSYNV